MRSDGGDTGCPPSHGTGCEAGVKVAGTTGDTSQQAFAARKDSGLIPDIDRALGELRADGTLKQISEKYFGTDVSGP